jgi:hypothetical protein
VVAGEGPQICLQSADEFPDVSEVGHRSLERTTVGESGHPQSVVVAEQPPGVAVGAIQAGDEPPPRGLPLSG